uniref:Putative N-acetylmuramoyl-L-alanine amidase n=1 Tax=viral metagenome TaxID=1070528 RepID=A0A6M3XXP7_9ZZZZ
MRQIRYIYLHCSASEWGDADEIRKWHKERGWRDIGYHYVILNAYPDKASMEMKKPQVYQDGEIEKGRPVAEQGAHALDYNEDSLGICLIGLNAFTGMQLLSLRGLLLELLVDYPDAKIRGHYEVDPDKTCPNINMDYLRGWLRAM